jgi:hypothetical protein
VTGRDRFSATMGCVSAGPGLITFARQLCGPGPTKETKAPFVAEYAPKPGTPIYHAADPITVTERLEHSANLAPHCENAPTGQGVAVIFSSSTSSGRDRSRGSAYGCLRLRSPVGQ